MIPRVVSMEVLDGLAQSNPDAMRSRRDLQRVHCAMGTHPIVLRALKSMTARHPKELPLRILEIGAGDGTLMLSVAQSLATYRSNVVLTLFDRQALVDPGTIARYGEVNWAATQEVGDVLDLAAGRFNQIGTAVEAHWDLIVANLFLHHFEGAQLASILGFIACRGLAFFACEPRRGWLALAGSHMIGAIGVNHVTREDSVLSVRAGFRGDEITALWPHRGGSWKIEEYSAGLFSHCFRAERTELN
jgi:hypothetical protein